MKGIRVIVFTIGIASTTVGMLIAQHQHAAPAKPQAAESLEVFCPTMKTGQLCSHGTADTLAVHAEKRDAWIAAVRKYNKAVNEATLQLQTDAKDLLTAEQLAEVQRWFAVGMNPQMNQLLAVPNQPKREAAQGAPR